MRAVIVNDYGQAPVLGEVPTSRAGPGQKLIRLRTAAVNHIDRWLARGDWRIVFPGTFPMGRGADGAGVVEAVGAGTTRFAPGDVVFGQLMVPPIGATGTYAEHVDEDAPPARVPDAMDLDGAAALPTIGMTGLAVTAMLGPLKGRTFLVAGVRGGVGSMATQFEVRAGAHVIAVAPEIAAERMRRYGAAEVIDPTTVSLPPEAVQRAHPGGIDALIDPVSDADRSASPAKLVRAGGSAVTTRFAVRAWAAKVSQALGGGLDVLVSNAGGLTPGPLEAAARRAPARRRGQRAGRAAGHRRLPARAAHRAGPRRPPRSLRCALPLPDR
jgi:NADPH2:quinone reductase